MAHAVLKRGRYWEVYESYRDERGRPRKRFLKYLGRYSIDWRATFASDLHGVDWDAIEREECERQDSEKAAYDAKLASLNELYGLRVGPVDPAPVEPSHAAPAPAPEPGADAQKETGPDEGPAEPS
jgi:hypothetical protein